MSHEKQGNPFLSEVLALRDGLTATWNQGALKVLCELDCRELVNMLKVPVQNQQYAQVSLLNDLRLLLQRSWRVELSWIHREGNAAANWLAKCARRL